MNTAMGYWAKHVLRMLLVSLCLVHSPVFAAGGGGGASGPYIELKPAFVVNYGGVGKIKYLKADISLRVDDPKAVGAVNHHMPLIRNALVLLFSRQTDEAMASVEGKEAMRQDSLTEINRLLAEETGEQAAINDVLFNNLVMQK